jgi:hypothetical protein
MNRFWHVIGMSSACESMTDRACRSIYKADLSFQRHVIGIHLARISWPRKLFAQLFNLLVFQLQPCDMSNYIKNAKKKNMRRKKVENEKSSDKLWPESTKFTSPQNSRVCWQHVQHCPAACTNLKCNYTYFLQIEN